MARKKQISKRRFKKIYAGWCRFYSVPGEYYKKRKKKRQQEYYFEI